MRGRSKKLSSQMAAKILKNERLKNFLELNFLKKPYISQILLKL